MDVDDGQASLRVSMFITTGRPSSSRGMVARSSRSRVSLELPSWYDETRGLQGCDDEGGWEVAMIRMRRTCRARSTMDAGR